MASISDLTLDPEPANWSLKPTNGLPVYTVSTKKSGSTTEVHTPGTNALVARIARKELLPSTVVFPALNDGKSIRIAKWLKRVTLPEGQGIADLSSIIAHWAPKTEPSPRTLIIAPGVERSHAQILAAFLYEDERLRKAVRDWKMEEQRRTHRTLQMSMNGLARELGNGRWSLLVFV
ncbi:hypothetical protein B0H13DRAFT_2401572 [Mycena leptocephala]|nr:hypothetical protein B0H13DRAFT_2401572 [Mycena leptocephala]